MGGGGKQRALFSDLSTNRWSLSGGETKTLFCLMNAVSGRSSQHSISKPASQPGVGHYQRWQILSFVSFLSKDFGVSWGFLFVGLVWFGFS